MIDALLFAPHTALAAALLPALPPDDDGAHDSAHLLRVWRASFTIAAAEPCDAAILAAAVLLHDCVSVEKASPLRSQASRLSAARAVEVLRALGWDTARTDAVAHAVAAHSFSARIAPHSAEARILQDADRLDAIGHIGIARLFYTAGRMGSALYHPADPPGLARPLDDRAYALDHFAAKLLRLGDGFQTRTGAAMAAARMQVLRDFVAGFQAELDGQNPAPGVAR